MKNTITILVIARFRKKEIFILMSDTIGTKCTCNVFSYIIGIAKNDHFLNIK